MVEEMLAARGGEHQPTRVHEKVMRRFKSARRLQRFASTHDEVANLFMRCRHILTAQARRVSRAQAFVAWEMVSCAPMMAFLAA